MGSESEVMVYLAGEYERLGQNQVDVWLTFVDDPKLDGLLDGYRQLLSDDERAQEKRFHFEADRRRHLITRTLLRCTLSRYVEVHPSAWRFAANDHGRPHIATPQGPAARMHFNISHTNGLIAVAVSLHAPLGIDTENLSRRATATRLAGHYFAAAEKADLQSLPQSQQPARFLEYWTLKESYIKARGMGLSIPLDRFCFDLARPGHIGFDADPSLGDGARWAFWQWAWGHEHLLALCAPLAGETPPSLRLWSALPLLNLQAEDAQPLRTSHPLPAHRAS